MDPVSLGQTKSTYNSQEFCMYIAKIVVIAKWLQLLFSIASKLPYPKHFFGSPFSKAPSTRKILSKACLCGPIVHGDQILHIETTASLRPWDKLPYFACMSKCGLVPTWNKESSSMFITINLYTLRGATWEVLKRVHGTKYRVSYQNGTFKS